MDSGGNRARSSKLPETIQEFLEIINTAPRPRAQVFGEPWGVTAPAWLRSTRIGEFWPPPEVIEEAFERMKTSHTLESSGPVFAAGHWGSAVKDTYRVMSAILDTIKPLADTPFLKGQLHLDDRCWNREVLSVGRDWVLEFSPASDTIAAYYRNLRNCLDGLDVRRLGRCQVEVPENGGNWACDDFYYGRRDKEACSERHAQLQRSRRWLLEKKGAARRHSREDA
jgi:hypothetical protein